MNRVSTILGMLAIALLISGLSHAQLSGTKTIDNTLPTGGNNYASFTDAFAALNTSGVGVGGVTFNVAAGQTFTESPDTLTATGTAGNPIVFQKSGGGANPKIIPLTAGTVASSTTIGAHGDGIIVMRGGDYITFNGIDLQTDAAFAGVGMMEYGYYLKKSSGADACKNITIQNCAITLNKTAVYSFGIFVSNIFGTATVTVTSTDGRSENIRLYNNTISNCYGGIQLRGYAASSPYDFYDQNIEVGAEANGNSITNYGGGASTPYGIYAIYQNNLKIGGNTVNGGSGTTTTLYGIFTSVGTSSNVDIFSNTVTIAGGGTTSTIYGINNGMGSTAAGNTVNIYNNTVTGCTYPTATSGATYLLYSTATPSKINMYGNTVSGNSTPGTGAMYCLYESGAVVDSVKIYNNTVINNTRSATGSMYGIYNSPAGTAGSEIFDNTVHGNTSAGGSVYGIYNAEGATDNIYRNSVYDQSTTAGTSSVVYGIYTATADSVRVFNNFISDLRATTSTGSNAIAGIYISSGTKIGAYFNSIFLNATSTSATNFGTSGIYASSTPTVDLRNNVVVNLSDPGPTGGGTVAYRRSTATLTTYANESNNNDFFVNTAAGMRRYFYGEGTTASVANADSTFADYKARVSPRDINSVAENPPFINVASTPYNLHINTATPTQLESGGGTVSAPIAITTDYDGNTRNATTPDIGADEFGGIAADLTGPTITYTDLANTSSTGNRSLSSVSITDASGVNTSSGTRPRLYYKRSTDANTYNDNTSGTDGWKYNEAAGGGGSPFSFTINYSLLNGGTGVATGQVVQYFVVAQDLAGPPNIGINSGTFNSAPSSVALTASAFPLTGSIKSYTIVPTVSGTYSVGAGADYTNLTAVAALLNNHSSEVSGNTIFELTGTYDGTTETLPIVFNEFNNVGLRAGLASTVTIRPALGVTGKVTEGDPGSGVTLPVINLVGADYFIFDGRPGGVGSANEWTIRNTRSATTIGCVIRFADDATYSVLRNLNIESQATSTTTGAVFFNTSTGTLGNSYDTLRFNNIRGRTDAANTISHGVYSSGSSGALNRGNVVSDNHISNFNSIGVNLASTGSGPDWTISNNQFYNSTTSALAQTGITVAADSATNTVISGNFIGGSAPNATGTWTNSGNVVLTGIAMSSGIGTITGNTIANMSGTNTGTTARTRGIQVTSDRDSVVISNNTIFNLSTMSGVVSGLTANSQAAVGIGVYSGATFYTSTVTGNTIYNISAENTTAFTTMNSAAGIFLTNFRGLVTNNTIYDIKNKSTGTTAGQPPLACGILGRFWSGGYVVNNMISLGTGENTNTQFNGIMVVTGESGNQHFYYHNTVSVGGTSGGSWGSFGFLRGDNTTTSPGSTINFYDNIVSNTRTGGGSINHAVGCQGTNGTLNFVSNYNDIFASDPLTIGLIDATSYNLAGWQSTSSGDANSISYATTFVGATDLHLNNVHNGDMNLKGTPIAGVTVDFDNQTRDTQAPYMGADELSIALPVQISSFTARMNQNGAGVRLDWRTISEVSNYGFFVQRKREGETEFTELPNSFVAGNGTTSEPHDYLYVDASLTQTGLYHYRLRQQDLNGASHLTDAVTINVTTLTDVPEAAPREFSLKQNYPNPFNPETVIKFSVENTAKTTLEVYNLLGQKVATLFDDVAEAGQYYKVRLNGSSFASGMYIYRLQSGSRIDVKKMLLLK
ncbi:MAG: T9SS type A sorting domain-containing protein [Ignavibacteriae bacterium]|nr:T9SS type A sorting domain-containing protein [Ignavibacteriota bacterium]